MHQLSDLVSDSCAGWCFCAFLGIKLWNGAISLAHDGTITGDCARINVQYV